MIKNVEVIISYILDLIKSSVTRFFFFMEIVGILLYIFTNLEITIIHLIILFALGLTVSNYKIYADNLPGINMNTSLLNKSPIRIGFASDNIIDFKICYNLYINNNGNTTGIIENIKVELVKFCNIKDEFLTNKLGVEFKGFFISDAETFAPIAYKENQVETKYPIILNPNQLIKKVLIMEICIRERNEEEYLKTIEWINDIEFRIITNVKYNNTDRQQAINLVVYKKDIEQRRKEHLKDFENLDDVFK